MFKAFSFFSIVFDILIICAGLFMIIFVITGDLEAYWALVILGLIGWGVWSLRKEFRDRRKKGEVSQLEEEREEIRKRMEEKEE